MNIMSVDIETYSSVDLVRSGVYAYSASPDFEILLFGYAFGGESIEVIDLASGEELPAEVLKALTDSSVIKSAYNANFERTCLAAHLKRPMPPEQWQCSSVHALMLGLPGYLDGVTKALKMKTQKDTTGKALIRYFSMPCKPTQTNGGRTRNLPEHDMEKWEQYKAYCAQDVQVERELRKILSRYPVPKQEQRLWELDQKINDAGVLVDKTLVDHAIICDKAYQKGYFEKAQKLTGVENPNSVAQLKKWIKKTTGREVKSLNKAAVKELMEETESDTVKKVLGLRQKMSKTSVKKYEAMERALCPDGRVRGLFQFYGANRTGRWAGRLVQVQNLPRNSLADLDLARQLLKDGNYELLELLYDSVPDVLSQLIRTALIPEPGCRFVVSDFSAIEARIIAWLAGEGWRMEVFGGHGKIYEASASQMFGVPVEEITKDSPLRQKGKVAELACIAEGQLVLTDRGLTPIERVSLNHKVWDGVDYVGHDGVIYRGQKEVITYDGLTATKDHLVWVEGESGPIRFKDAATSGAHILRSGAGRKTIRVGQNHQSRKTMERKLAGHCKTLRKARVYDILNAGPRNRFTVSDCLAHNCGYGGSVGALKAMGALEMGLTEEELPGLIRDWRTSNPNIVQFWWTVGDAAMDAVRNKTAVQVHHGIEFSFESGGLFLRLPSGRRLCYVQPQIRPHRKFNRPTLTYMGVTQGRNWGRIETYGPKLVENIVQATARDCLAEALLRLDQAGYKIVMHVHDEAVLEMPEGAGSLEEACEIMAQPLEWAPGLPLPADGFETEYYKKD